MSDTDTPGSTPPAPPQADTPPAPQNPPAPPAPAPASAPSGFDSSSFLTELNAWTERTAAAFREATTPASSPAPPATPPAPPATPPATPGADPTPPPADTATQADKGDKPGRWKWEGGKGWFK